MEIPKAPLAERLARLNSNAKEPGRDAILSEFLEYVADLGITLYPAQEQAILELLEYRHVILNTPTGSGKSLVAIALHFQAMAEGRISYYTSPIKALVNEKFFDLCDAFGPENVGLLTGDASVNRGAPILCCTAEILANMALGTSDLPAYVVMDEFHFYGDAERGMAWQVPLVTAMDTVFLLMSATLGDVTAIVKSVEDYTDRDVRVIVGTHRPVPLTFGYRETPLHETINDLIAAGEAPIYLVNFTQRACAEQAQNLTSVPICCKEDRQRIAAEIQGFRFDTPYGKEIQRFLRAGIGIHHAGLLPRYRLLVEKLSQAGLLKVVSGTDSLGVGVNIPIRTVIFTQLCKFDGEKMGIVTARQFHQIAGRAGRKGFDDHGLVVVQAPEHVIENRLMDLKIAANPHLKKKLVKRRPPERGYVHWDKATFERLRKSPPEPLSPRFGVSHGMIVNVLRTSEKGEGSGYRRLLGIIGRSHIPEAEKRRQARLAAQLFRSLRKAGIVELASRGPGLGSTVKLHAGLQSDFSLHHALSLYVVETLDLLDPEAETHGLDMITLVEAVVEDPDVILLKQKDRVKDVLVPKLKAQGMPYEERMAVLEGVENPKPNAEFLAESFAAFSEVHPWIAGDHLRPKSVARDIFEKGMGFNEYVRAYGLQRSEGVLLRYLSEVYKASMQTVPQSYRSEAFEDILAFYRTLIHRTDASLLEEWERMMAGEIVRPVDRYRAITEKPQPKDLARDPKAFTRRVRSEMHMLLRALADRDFDAAVAMLRPATERTWTAAGLEEALKAYHETHRGIDVTPQARTPAHTLVRQTAGRRWEVVQRIVDLDGEDDWALFGEVDLTADRDESDPLIALVRIGE